MVNFANYSNELYDYKGKQQLYYIADIILHTIHCKFLGYSCKAGLNICLFQNFIEENSYYNPDKISEKIVPSL